MNALLWTFAGLPVQHRCALSDEGRYDDYWRPNLSYYIDFDVGDNSTCRSDLSISRSSSATRCAYKQCNFNDGSECSSYVVDNSIVRQSALGRWDLFCDQSWISAFIQSSYYFGEMTGSFVFGILGDRIGRQKVLFIAMIIEMVCSAAQGTVPFWWMYAIFRFGTGFAHPGIFGVAIVIGMELVGPRYRKRVAFLCGIFFALGLCILGVIAMYISDYQYLHLAVAAPCVLFLSYWWLIPESVLWLVSAQRFAEADKVLQRAAKINRVKIPEGWWITYEEESKITQKEESFSGKGKCGFIDLVRTPEMRKRTLVVFFLWPVVSMIYYGLSMKSNMLGGDLHTNFIISGFIEIPALIIVFLLIDRIGRRYVLTIGYSLSGICLLSNLLIPDNANEIISLIQFAVSKGSITGTFISIYMFTPELFPTEVRNLTMGMCSTIAQIGAIISSFATMWIADSVGKIFIIIPFGVLALCAASLMLVFLPETMNKPLPATIDEVENTNSTTREASNTVLKF